MVEAKYLTSSIIKLENNNLFLFSLFITISLFHTSLLMNSKEMASPTMNYSNEVSKQISVKVKLSTLQRKKVVRKKKVKSSQHIKKKVLAKPESTEKKDSSAIVENKEVKKSLGSNTVMAMYMSNIRSLINKNKVYPAAAKRLKHEGRIKVEILINSKGDIVSKKYLEKSQSLFLNNAIEEIFKKIKNFGVIPSGIKKRPLRVIIPIVYQLI